jgi:light-regulated signal transduction histidine kinase (bacteriophytochrome)
MDSATDPPAPDTDVAQATQLAQVHRELQGLTYAISHDLRAPVRAIVGFGQALKEHVGGNLDETGLHLLSRIEQSTQRLSAMIEGLLQLSRIAQAELQLAQVDLTALCHSVAAQLCQQQTAPAPQLHIESGMRARCDPQLLRLAIQALLHNAWKFCQHRSDAAIRISAVANADSVILCVRDNGIGIDMRYADRLFVPFQHLQSRTELNGVGIGLASVQRVANRHDGTAWAEATPQQFAAFYLSLPQASVGAADKG